MFYEINTAFRGFTRTLRAAVNFHSVETVFSELRPVIYNILNISPVLRLRVIICLHVIFTKILSDELSETTVSQTYYFCSHALRILSAAQILPAVDEGFRKIINSIETFTKNGSGWVLSRIDFADLHIGNFADYRGGCKTARLPVELSNKRALLSIDCSDNKCFVYSVLAALFPKKKNAGRSSSYKKHLQAIDIKMLKFPVEITNIKMFETVNKVKINVFSCDEGMIYPLYTSSQNFKEIDLFLHEKHFYLIRNINSLLKTKKHFNHYCKRCLNGFVREQTLIEHQTLCIHNRPQRVSIPENLFLKFKNWNRCLKHRFVIFADFECLLSKISSAAPNVQTSFTQPLEKHIPISYAMIVINQDDKIIYHKYYVGNDAVEHFLNTAKDISFRLITELKKVSEIEMDDSSMYDSSKCGICHKKFKTTDRIVRHHLHNEPFVSCKAHQLCNLQYKKRFFIPIFLHNAKSYDSHLLLRYLPKDFAKEISIIPINLEKISMFTLDHLKILDSFQFLDGSLDTLIENLLISKHEFKIFDSFFRENKNKYLLYRKGIFPYSYMDNIDKLQVKGLPSREAFFNILTQKHITQKEYIHALAVFRAFDCKTFSDYLKLYQNTDVLMLAEVFCAFRNLSLKYYELDPVHYISISELTFDAGLKFCKIELQLLGNINDYIWLESQMRGGICLVGRRYARANNPSLPSIYDPSKPHSYILALDIVNLYGYAMSQFLPYGDFYWLSLEEINNFDVLTIPQNNDKGFILEVDLEIPESEHDRLNDLPLAPEHLKITREMLSPYAEKLCTKFGLQNTFPSKKLAPNFYPKTHYIVHYLTLQFYLKQGLKLTKIHKILMFSQKPWLREYIDFNNSKRMACNTQSEKLFFKKLNNSFYGKCLQNVRKRISVKGALTIEACKKYLASPALDYFEPLNESLTLFKMKQTNLRLDKPIYIGFTVLEISKLRLYELYFSYFKKIYDSKCTLLYTDTDSLYLYIETPNIQRDIQHNFTNIMDLSNFEKSHPLFCETNKGRLGTLKNETCLPIKEFVGLKPKMYSLLCEDRSEKKTAKGVKKSSLISLSHERYKQVLQDELSIKDLQYSIISRKHVLETVVQNKTTLSSFYDKKFLCDDGITTLAYGHKEINQ